MGASSDYTNELFYEDAFVDTTFLGRQLVDSPESRIAGVAFFRLDGTRSRRLVSFELQNELSLGNKVDRNILWLNWRDQRTLDWRFTVSPRIEYRHDRTFDRDLREWRGQLDARARRTLGDPWTFFEAKGSGEFLRTSGTGSTFLLDRQTARASLSFERSPLFGSEWRVGYRLAGRSFPDSSERDHLEHGWEGRWRRDLANGHWVQLEVDGVLRSPSPDASTSRDDFWDNTATLEGAIGLAANRSWRTRVALETLNYAREDSTLFFDYQVARAFSGPRIHWTRWTLTAGPQWEALFSPRNPFEEYREYGAAIELEFMNRGVWWSLSPAAGWRDYSDAVPADPLDPAAIHSSYAFYELAVIADQPIGKGVRLRLFASGRIEEHVDQAQDARSLYFSLDLRRLF